MKRVCFRKNTNRHDNHDMRVLPIFLSGNLKTNYLRMKSLKYCFLVVTFWASQWPMGRCLTSWPGQQVAKLLFR